MAKNWRLSVVDRMGLVWKHSTGGSWRKMGLSASQCPLICQHLQHKGYKIEDLIRQLTSLHAAQQQSSLAVMEALHQNTEAQD
ncbi:hypothetical protein AAFF_G00024170 [Aldrovandia affinis]|uniref:Uncharacterized protein n=1 Tax=Aldrovandia affinis TaxID=143900 RepID=A0AAD7T5Q3_9TELE|nr:hypothetical protein AAFF_G00024170 [Aldrovandia affinis]